jgi:hypothetical protein
VDRRVTSGLHGGFSTILSIRYKIEVSTGGKSYSTVLDKTDNSVTRYTEFDEISPLRCRYIHLTLTDWPRMGDLPLGIVEFTVFGKAAEPQSR